MYICWVLKFEYKIHLKDLYIVCFISDIGVKTSGSGAQLKAIHQGTSLKISPGLWHLYISFCFLPI